MPGPAVRGHGGGRGTGKGGPKKFITEDPPEVQALEADLKRVVGSPEGRARLAILEACKGAILERKGALSCATYTSALLSSLAHNADEEVTQNVIYLLWQMLQHLPEDMMRSKFPTIADALIDSVEKYPESAAVARHALHALSTAISVQEDAAWAAPQMTRAIQAILSHSADARPKIRKGAQGIIISLVSGESSSSKAAKSHLEGRTVHFCGQVFKSCTSADVTTSQHLLGFVRELASKLSSKPLAALAQHVAALLAVDSKTIFPQVAGSLAAVVREGDTSQLSPKTMAGILSSVMEHEPPPLGMGNNNSEPHEAYVALLSALLDKYSESDPEACGAMVPKVFTAVSAYCLPSGSEKLPVAAANMLCQLIDMFVPHEDPQISKAVSQMVSHTEMLLHPRYKASLQYTLPVAHSFFNRLRTSSRPALDKIVLALVQLVPAVQGLAPEAQDQLDQALGAALHHVGPEGFLQLAPIFATTPAVDLSNKNNRTWLLPILKKHVRGAPLAYFCQHLLPVADQVRQQAIVADGQKRPVEAKNLIMVHEQIWGLLPSFMTECTDLPASFPVFAQRLGVTIEQEPSLRACCISALTQAIKSSRAATEDASDTHMGDAGAQAAHAQEPYISKDMGAANMACLAHFSKNYLPILFNVCGQTPVAQRPVILDAIEAYVGITDKARLGQFFSNVMKKLLTATVEEGESAMDTDEERDNKKVLLMDLSMALMPGLEAASADFLFKATVPLLRDNSGGVQKRAYKLLQLMGVHHIALVQTKLEELCEALVEALPECSGSATKWRLRCLHKLVELLPIDAAYMRLLGAILGEVMLGTKQASRKSRDTSFSMLVCMAQRIDASGSGHLVDLFSMILAGLAGTTPHMISAAVLALSRLVYEYSSRVGNLAPPLLESMLLLLEHKSREIVTAALGLAKVISVSLPEDMLLQYMNPFINALLLWSKDSRNRFRLKVKVILERLMRRVSYDTVLAATPEEHHKLIISIHKRVKRAKNHKKKGGAGEDDKEGGEQEPSSAGRRVVGGYEEALYGGEDVESEDDDDMDDDGDVHMEQKTSAGVRRGLGAGAGARKDAPGEGDAPKRNVHGFPVSKDGRAVIVDSRDTENAVLGKKRKRQEEEAFAVVGDVDAEAKEKEAEKAVMSNANAAHKANVALGGAKAIQQAGAGRSWDQAATLRKKRKTQAPSKVLGLSEFVPKAASTGGDMKRAGRPDPFAYIAFDKRALNKRKKHQPAKSLKSLFNASKSTSATKRKH